MNKMNRRKYIKSSARAAGSIALSAFSFEKLTAKDESKVIPDHQNSISEINIQMADPDERNSAAFQEKME
jgi:hypothetical protein